MPGQNDKDVAHPKGAGQTRSASAVKAADVRAERLAAALRENLKRRKTQVRGRQSDASGPSEAGHGEVVSEPVDKSNT